MCPVCATSLATWLLAGALGSGGVTAVALHGRKKRNTLANVSPAPAAPPAPVQAASTPGEMRWTTPTRSCALADD